MTRVFGRMTRAGAVLTGIAAGACIALGVTAGVALSVERDGVPAGEDDPAAATSGAATVETGVDSPGPLSPSAAASDADTGASTDADPAEEAAGDGSSNPPSPDPESTGAADATDAAAARDPSAQPMSDSAELADVRQRELRLPLPPLTRGLGTVSRDAVKLADLPVSDPAACELNLVGADVVFGVDQTVRMRSIPLSDGTRQWNVEQVGVNSVTGAPVLGVFRLKDRALWFEWGRAATTNGPADALRYCLLQVQADGESELCLLTERQTAPAAAVNLRATNAKTDLGLTLPNSTFMSQLQFEILPQRFPQYSLVRGSGAEDPEVGGLEQSIGGRRSLPGGPGGGLPGGSFGSIGDAPMAPGTDVSGPRPAELTVLHFQPLPDANVVVDGDFVELEVRFVEDKGRVSLTIQPYVHRQEIAVDYSTISQRRAFAFSDIAGALKEQARSRTALQVRLAQAQKQSSLEEQAQDRINELLTSGSVVVGTPAHDALQEQLERTTEAATESKAVEESIQAAIDLTVQNDLLIEEVRRLYAQLEASGAIGYRVYLLINGRRVDILDGTGSRDAATPARPLTLELN